MTPSPSAPEERYAALIEALRGSAHVTHPSHGIQTMRRFGSTALKIDDKIFAMLVKGRLVVKLPRRRVDELVASGDGERFDPGHGRLMKEWLALEPTSEVEWLPLAREAMEFVAAGR